MIAHFPGSVRNVVQSGESSVSISAKVTACRPRRQQLSDAEGLELAAVDAHRHRAGQHVRAVDVGRVEIDEAALQGPANGRRAGAGRHGPPALGREDLAGVRPDREIDERMRLVADAEVGAGRAWRRPQAGRRPGETAFFAPRASLRGVSRSNPGGRRAFYDSWIAASAHSLSRDGRRFRRPIGLLAMTIPSGGRALQARGAALLAAITRLHLGRVRPIPFSRRRRDRGRRSRASAGWRA